MSSDEAMMETSAERAPGATPRPNPTLAVIGWELRRMEANRATWAGAGVLLLFLLGTMWLTGEVTVRGYFTPQEERITVHGGSAWGMVYTMPVLLLALGVVLPFLSADAVARDLKQRTHETLMSTPIPTSAYVWGRFLAALLGNLALSVLMLAGILLVGAIAASALGAPFPNVPATLALWAVALVPAVALVSGCSFTLGTLMVRYTGFAKALLVVAWFLASYEGLFIRGADPASLVWDPTGRSMIGALGAPYQQALFRGLDAMPGGQSANGESRVLVPGATLTQQQLVQALRGRMLTVEQQMPDLWPWVGPHAALAVAGLAAPAVAAARFRRFNDQLSE